MYVSALGKLVVLPLNPTHTWNKVLHNNRPILYYFLHYFNVKKYFIILHNIFKTPKFRQRFKV